MCNCSAAEFGGAAKLVDEVLVLGRMNPCDSGNVVASSVMRRRPMFARIVMVEFWVGGALLRGGRGAGAGGVAKEYFVVPRLTKIYFDCNKN